MLKAYSVNHFANPIGPRNIFDPPCTWGTYWWSKKICFIKWVECCPDLMACRTMNSCCAFLKSQNESNTFTKYYIIGERFREVSHGGWMKRATGLKNCKSRLSMNN